MPVLAMVLPHPQSFAAIHEYLYTNDAVAFAARIMPYPLSRATAPYASHEYATWAGGPAAMYHQQVLIERLTFAAGAYANICALGIHDDGIWHALQASWTVLYEALCVTQHAYTCA